VFRKCQSICHLLSTVSCLKWHHQLLLWNLHRPLLRLHCIQFRHLWAAPLQWTCASDKKAKCTLSSQMLKFIASFVNMLLLVDMVDKRAKCALSSQMLMFVDATLFITLFFNVLSFVGATLFVVSFFDVLSFVGTTLFVASFVDTSFVRQCIVRWTVIHRPDSAIQFIYTGQLKKHWDKRENMYIHFNTALHTPSPNCWYLVWTCKRGLCRQY